MTPKLYPHDPMNGAAWSAAELAALAASEGLPLSQVRAAVNAAGAGGRTLRAINNKRAKLRLSRVLEGQAVHSKPKASCRGDAKRRACLWCGGEFESGWPGNRRCGGCKEREEREDHVPPLHMETRATALRLPAFAP